MQTIDIQHNNTQEIFKLDYLAKQSSSSILYQQGNTVLLASVAIAPKEIEGDFVPFSVQYIEKSYAVGRIPAGFIKREGKLGEFEILTSRIIDRTLRPLFPKNYRYLTHITLLVLSHDGKSDLQVCALNACANALMLSEVPFKIPVASVRIGRIKDEFCINPNVEMLEKSTLDLFVSGSHQDILMIEMKGSSTQGVDEEEFLKALEMARGEIAALSQKYEQNLAGHKKKPLLLDDCHDRYSEAVAQIISNEHHDELAKILNQMAKSERHSELEALSQRLLQKLESHHEAEVIHHTLQQYKRNLVRTQILKERVRVDGRALDEVRPIAIETNILPCAHGSALFTRGQTQALVVATLGSDNDAQAREILGQGNQKDYFTLHYNFPGFSVGEASMITSPSRREIGHGNLAKKALEDSIIDKTQTIRLVSEILESNGSSSMASVCGGSLALAASGVQTSGLIAGVAMGLIQEGEEYAILTDIMGLEDHDGDMDFKVAGNELFITAMQMDIKLGGMSLEIFKQALYQAARGRKHILAIMQSAASRIVVNDAILPKVEEFAVPVDKIVEIIGSGGKMIKEIIERFNVNVDLDRDKGGVKLFGTNPAAVLGAKDFILELVGKKSLYEIGDVIDGVVRRVVDFGIFVSLPKGGDGLVHSSKFLQNRTQKPSEYFQEGQRVQCSIIGFNKGKVDLDLIR